MRGEIRLSLVGTRPTCHVQGCGARFTLDGNLNYDMNTERSRRREKIADKPLPDEVVQWRSSIRRTRNGVSLVGFLIHDTS